VIEGVANSSRKNPPRCGTIATPPPHAGHEKSARGAPRGHRSRPHVCARWSGNRFAANRFRPAFLESHDLDRRSGIHCAGSCS